MKPLTLKSGSVLVGVAAALLSCEIGIRVFDFARGRSSNARAFWYWLYEQDPYMGHRGRAHARASTGIDDIEHNAEGFRDDRDMAELERIKDRKLVICVGESSTYGIGAGSNRQTYPAVLEGELRALSGDQRWVVLNAGMPGYTSHEILEVINLRLMKLHPDIIVSMNLANDHDFIARYLDGRQDYNFFPIRLAQRSSTAGNEILMRSSLFALVASKIRVFESDDLGGSMPATVYDHATQRGVELYLDDLAMTELLASRRGAQLMMVDQPIDYRQHSSSEVASFEAMRAELAAFCRTSRCPLLEAHTALDWTGLQPQDDVHLGSLGYARLAKLLAPQILDAARPSPLP